MGFLRSSDTATGADSKATLLVADGGSSASSRRTSSWSMPVDLLEESVRRLRVVAGIYALAFFLAGPLVTVLSPGGAKLLFSVPVLWVPAAMSIAGALLMVALASQPNLSPRLKIHVGLVFEILGSFGIAAAEYHHIAAPISYGQFGYGSFGMSWVSLWVLFFSIIVPTAPMIGLVSAALSVAAVPTTYAIGVALGSNVPLDPSSFFFSLVFPYCVILMMVYASGRVVYHLGAEVRKARELGSYRLVERLGEGGMGEVWRAEHRMLARPAAIKLIRPEMLGATSFESRRLMVRRFEREAQATALMRSPHTMNVYDFGVADDGTFYYVMELLDGFDLDELVERFGPVPAERAVYFLLQMCDSLAEAHEAGLIHRDVKPANVYLCRYGRESDFIKLLDFGLVKHGVPERGAEKLTLGVVAGGTPAFMSPEQALGEEQIDHRSDIYAVGCVAYWLLTGSLVFKGSTTMETLVMHVDRVPEPPSQRTELPIPPQLDAIVLACLAKRPEARPQTAEELATRLASVPLAREWNTQRAREWWNLNRPTKPSVGRPSGK
jgi:serine/threonine-protein kinase